jgi:hypothetical protein
MGADQTITPSGSAVYTLDITNNDSASCPDTTFDLNILSETGDTGAFTLPSNLSAASVLIAPQANNTSVTLTVDGDGSGTLTSTVRVSDTTFHSGQEQDDPVTTTICARNAPTFTMGANQNIAPAGTAVYTLDITNNDSASCAATTFDLNILSETGDTGAFTLPSNLSAASVLIAPQANNTSVTLTVDGDGSGTVEVRDDTDHSGQQQTDPVTTTVTVACTRNAPTFTMGADQNIASGGSAIYTLDITNNDTAACADTTFDLNILSETGDTGAFTLPSNLSAASVVIAAQANNTSVNLTVDGNGSGTGGEALTSTVRVSDTTFHSGQEQDDPVITTVTADPQFNITSCSDCHNLPPDDASTRGTPAGAVIGAHGIDFHVSTAPTETECNNCHFDDTPGGNEYTHRDGSIEMVNPIKSQTGSFYDKDMDDVQEGTDNTFDQVNDLNGTGLGNCANTYCHGTDSFQWGTPQLSAYDHCTICHGDPVDLTADGSASTHKRAPGADGVGVDTEGQTGTITSNVSDDPQVGAHDAHMLLPENLTDVLNSVDNCNECHKIPPTIDDADHWDTNGLPAEVFTNNTPDC